MLVTVPDGITATLLAGRMPAIAMTAARPVTIYGQRGEEMARVTPTTIEVNDASPTWRVTAESHGEPPGSGWRPLYDALFTWLEPRARVIEGARETHRWRVPVAVDGRRTEITGETRFGGPDSASDEGPPVSPYAVGAAALATGALVVLQLRRATAKGGLSSREL